MDDCHDLPIYAAHVQENPWQQFDERAYQGNWQQPFLLLYAFLNRYSRREFELVGNPLLSMVLAEIWLFNRNLAARGANSRPQKCNAYYVALKLGLPAQTVGRKVKTLMQMGWVEKSPGGRLSVTRACEQAFHAACSLETMRDFVATAGQVLALLQNLPGPGAGES